LARRAGSPAARTEKIPERKCNLEHLPEKSAAAHRRSCKGTAFTKAIHILSTIEVAQNVIQGALCAISCTTQPEKSAQIRRIFAVAQFADPA
jgi:hypothetical protein